LLSPQLEIVAPKVIVALGRCAAIHLGVAGETGPWRGIWREWRGTAVMSTHHPADVLRTPEHRREVWEDLQLVMSRLGRALPPKSGT
jgi:DNA polymerase